MSGKGNRVGNWIGNRKGEKWAVSLMGPVGA